MQISAQALFTAIKEDPKQAKALIKSASTPDIKTARGDIKQESAIVQKATQNANQTLDKIFSSLSKGEITKSQAVLQVQKNPIFKSDKPALSDLKSLVELVKKEPKLSKFVQPLKEFVKHVSTADGKDLKSQINKSGIGFEAKLATQTKLPILPPVLKEALKQIVDLKVTEDKNIPKEIKNLQTQVKELIQSKEVFKLDIKLIRQGVANAIKELPSLPPKIQNALKILDKLDDIVKKIDLPQTPKSEKSPDVKIAQETKSQNAKIPHVAKEDIAKLVDIKKQDVIVENAKINPKQPHGAKVSANLKFENGIKEVLQDIKTQINSSKIKLSIENLNQIKSTIKEIEVLIKELQKPQTTQTIQAPQIQNLQLPQVKLTPVDLNLQDKIKMMTSRIKQSLEIDNKGVVDNFKNHKVLKQTLNTIDKNISNLPPKQTSEVELSLKNDIKPTLNHLKDSPIKEISNLSNKILTNIETNQLLSFANNSVNSFIPYAWEGLKEGNVAFKQGKDDSFFCQLDLNLKVYGRVDMMLMLTNDNYISLSIGAEKQMLAQKLDEYLPNLKQSLTKVGLTPLHVKIKPFKSQNEYDSDGWSKFSMNLKV